MLFKINFLSSLFTMVLWKIGIMLKCTFKDHDLLLPTHLSVEHVLCFLCLCLISYIITHLAIPSQDIFYEIHCGHTGFALQFLACKRLSIQLEMNSFFKALGICAGGRHRHITGFDKINMFSNCQQLPRRNFF